MMKIEDICMISFKLPCLYDLGHINHDATSNPFIYAGKSSPDVNSRNINWKRKFLKDGYQLFWTFQNGVLFPLKPPVSVSLTSLAFQTRQLSNFDVMLFKMALGNRGGHPFCMSCDGHNSCPDSIRKDNTRANVVSNAGPNKQSHWTYYGQGMDVCIFPTFGAHSMILSH